MHLPFVLGPLFAIDTTPRLLCFRLAWSMISSANLPFAVGKMLLPPFPVPAKMQSKAPPGLLAIAVVKGLLPQCPAGPLGNLRVMLGHLSPVGSPPCIMNLNMTAELLSMRHRIRHAQKAPPMLLHVQLTLRLSSAGCTVYHRLPQPTQFFDGIQVHVQLACTL